MNGEQAKTRASQRAEPFAAARGRARAGRHRADVRRAPGGENELLAAKGGAALARREGRGGGQRRSRKELGEE